MYGLVDAFALYDDCNPETSTPPQLLAIIGLHVDDLLGTADKSHPKVTKMIEELKNIFTFREWKEGPSLEYCGATLEATDGGWKLHHKEYLKKVKPITVGKDRQPHQQVTDKERNLLRSLLGALQWPAVQSSPHLQIHTSMFSGEITTATIETIHNTNKALRYAKSNDDVGLTYRPIAHIADCCLVAWSDAAFASRKDHSSQGGFIVALMHKDAIEKGFESEYHILDWHSFRLLRVARSTLAAESQAAAEAADALTVVARYISLLMNPNLKLDDPMLGVMNIPATLVVDAKALYDLLEKREVQASLGSDTRTAIEVIVAKEKLVNGKSRWVSSERQMADGLTKVSAAQLLVDDSTYQAAGKKTPFPT